MTSVEFNISSNLVYFRVNVMELFGIDLNYRGIISCLNIAFMESKLYVPVETGLMKRSYTMRKINNTTVECYFDPSKIIGKTREGYTVKEYYPQYLSETPSRYNWLDIIIKHFFDKLKVEVQSLIKRNEEKDSVISMAGFLMFMDIFNEQYKNKKEKAKKLKKLEEDKKKNKEKIIREKFKNKILEVE